MSGEDEGGVVEKLVYCDEVVVAEAGGEQPVPELADGGADEAGAGSAAGPGGGVDDGGDVGEAGGEHGAVDVPGPGAVGTAGVEQPSQGVLEAVVGADVLGTAGVHHHVGVAGPPVLDEQDAAGGEGVDEPGQHAQPLGDVPQRQPGVYQVEVAGEFVGGEVGLDDAELRVAELDAGVEVQGEDPAAGADPVGQVPGDAAAAGTHLQDAAAGQVAQPGDPLGGERVEQLREGVVVLAGVGQRVAHQRSFRMASNQTALSAG